MKNLLMGLSLVLLVHGFNINKCNAIILITKEDPEIKQPVEQCENSFNTPKEPRELIAIFDQAIKKHALNGPSNAISFIEKITRKLQLDVELRNGAGAGRPLTTPLNKRTEECLHALKDAHNKYLDYLKTELQSAEYQILEIEDKTAIGDFRENNASLKGEIEVQYAVKLIPNISKKTKEHSQVLIIAKTPDEHKLEELKPGDIVKISQYRSLRGAGYMPPYVAYPRDIKVSSPYNPS